MSDINETVERIQAEVLNQLKKIYSKKVIHHWQQPRNWGIMHDADGYAIVHPWN